MFYNAIGWEIGKSGNKDMKLRRVRDDSPSGNSFPSEWEKVTKSESINFCVQTYLQQIVDKDIHPAS